MKSQYTRYATATALAVVLSPFFALSNAQAERVCAQGSDKIVSNAVGNKRKANYGCGKPITRVDWHSNGGSRSKGECRFLPSGTHGAYYNKHTNNTDVSIWADICTWHEYSITVYSE